MSNVLQKLLVLNSGSSSLKYAVFNVVNKTVKSSCVSGIVEKIGEDCQNVKLSYINSDDKHTKEEGLWETLKEERKDLKSHKQALRHVLLRLSELQYSSLTSESLAAVGHRVVHGGERLTKACSINDNVVDAIEQASLLAPLHNPANLSGIKTAMELFPPTVEHVAVFDTAFHSTIPKHSYLYAIPYKYYTDHAIRKYGFHGTSHEYVMNEAGKFLNKPIETLNLISCHLGAGASMCCIKKGVSIDTSMGMTPLSGLMMQTRSGDLDPGIVFYLMKHLDLNADQAEQLLLKRSGWFGLSGYQDARNLEEAYLENNVIAITAVKCIVHRIKNYLGSYYWNLNGDVDAVVFTAGVGENWPSLRELCFDDATKLGFDIDKTKNSNTYLISGPVDVSSKRSGNRILVIPTDEEYSIACKTLEVVNAKVD